MFFSSETPLFDIQDKPKVPEPANPTGVLLYSFTGPESHIFRRSSNTSGIYTVFIKPTESDTYVKLFLKSKPVAPSKDRDYPRLPRNSSIRVDRIRRKSFTVSWFPSQDETPYGNIITYCISVSPKRSFDNYCSLMSHKFGDKVPKNTGFFFPWEDDIVNLFRSKARPVKPAKPKDIFYTCVGRDTSYIFTQAKPGTKYNVNVYAINKQHNLSSAYKKLSVTSKKRKKRQRVKKLRNGKLQEVEFTKKKLEYNFKYVLKNTSDLYIAVHSCTGRVTFRVSRGHGRGQNVKKIIKKKVKRTSTFKVGNLEADTYFISVSSRKKDVPKTARLMVSTSQRKVRYPSLPRKANVFLVDNSTTHNSLTIGWLGTISRQKYCIYKKEILLTARRKRRRNQCSKNSESPVKDSTKVTCIVVRHEKPNMVLNHQIRNLKSKTSYQFDVVIQLGKGYTLLYNSLVASTKVHP